MNAELLAQAKAQIEALTATLKQIQEQPKYESEFALNLEYYVSDLEELVEYCDPDLYEDEDEDEDEAA